MPPSSEAVGPVWASEVVGCQGWLAPPEEAVQFAMAWAAKHLAHTWTKRQDAAWQLLLWKLKQMLRPSGVFVLGNEAAVRLPDVFPVSFPLPLPLPLRSAFPCLFL